MNFFSPPLLGRYYPTVLFLKKNCFQKIPSDEWVTLQLADKGQFCCVSLVGNYTSTSPENATTTTTKKREKIGGKERNASPHFRYSFHRDGNSKTFQTTGDREK